jgi:homoserine kinase
MIPGFDAVKAAALAAGAIGCSISGAGPSVFALCAGGDAARRAGDAMRAAFERSGGMASDVFVSRVGSAGARIERA